jgi:hypothetical protein
VGALLVMLYGAFVVSNVTAAHLPGRSNSRPVDDMQFQFNPATVPAANPTAAPAANPTAALAAPSDATSPTADGGAAPPTPVVATIPAGSGGSLTSLDGSLTVSVPAETTGNPIRRVDVAFDDVRVA